MKAHMKTMSQEEQTKYIPSARKYLEWAVFYRAKAVAKTPIAPPTKVTGPVNKDPSGTYDILSFLKPSQM
jgi:hypothetical protein